MTPPLLPERLEAAITEFRRAEFEWGLVAGHASDTVAAARAQTALEFLRACLAELVRERDEAREQVKALAEDTMFDEQVARAVAAEARAERAEAALREIAAGARSQGAHVGMSWLRVERIAERVLQAEAHAGTAEEPPKPVSLVAALKEAVAKEAGRKMLNNDVSLKACWRCGGDAFLTTPIGNSCYVACNNGICGATSPAFTGKHRAVRWWNQRAGAVESGLVPVPQDGLAPTGSEQPASPAPLGREPSRWSLREIDPSDEQPLYDGMETDPDGEWVRWEDVRVPSGPDPVQAAAQRLERALGAYFALGMKAAGAGPIITELSDARAELSALASQTDGTP